MPTESSVVSDLIRNMNTRQLESEPSDQFLFDWSRSVPVPPQPQPAPLAPVRPPAAPAQAASKPARVKAPRAARVKLVGDRGHWWSFSLAMLVIGGWFYGAMRLDSDDETYVKAALPVPAAAIALSAVPKSPVVVTSQPIEQPAQAPAAAPTPPPTEPSVATDTETAKHRGPAKRKHAKRVKSEDTPTVEKAEAPKAESTKTSKDAPKAEAPKAAPPPPPPPPRPTGPVQQSGDDENPLKR